MTKLEKLRRSLEQEEAAAAAAACARSALREDLLALNYGDVPLSELQSKTIAAIKDILDEGPLIRGQAQTIRAVGKNMAFIVVRENY